VIRCRSCDAPLRWAKTPKGKRIPLDPDPRPDGNIRLGFVGGEEMALVLSGAELEAAQIAGPVYVSHFATCPNASSHRRSAA
jgi:hypothetical protein